MPVARLGRGQHERLFELEDVLGALGIANVERRPSAAGSMEVDLARLWHGDVDAVEHDLDGIIVGIVAEAKKPNPVCLNLIAKLERGGIHLNRLALEPSADTVKELS